MNKQRKVGSQSESPGLALHDKNSISMTGYQHYKITPGKKFSYGQNSSRTKKYNIIERVLSQLQKQGATSISDLGCSNGLVCFLAHKHGFKTIKGYDHDVACVDLVNKAANHTQTPIKAFQYSFGDSIEPTDVVVAGALIHWIFSCTANYGSFDKIFQYFRSITKKALLIEWVGPQDGAIKSFGHTQYNKNTQKEKYTLQNFEASLKRHFSHVQLVSKHFDHRWFFLARTTTTAKPITKHLKPAILKPKNKYTRKRRLR